MISAPHWFKSTYSGDEGGACIEVAVTPHAIHIRDSKTAEGNDGPTFTTSPEAWSAFTAYAAH
ncbi:DUF397 domain-containing protein [Streptomyces tailanensis]|uniref:DUF397 domain-containing protein n=1 Tax=Streptomyces tailanensis TaxID=2569858 RepID=UPI00122DDDE5|nr:DUF397 domain-containing protein [Streptomyces tailanensis]